MLRRPKALSLLHAHAPTAMARCKGTTRAGKRCSLTGTSRMTDDTGRLVAQPLRCGGEYCALHAKPFVVKEASVMNSAVLVFLDLETTGVDVARDRIVELAATHSPADSRLAGSSYSTVVRVDPQLLQARGGAAAAIHGITDEEIARGPDFLEAWGRFLQWVRRLLDTAVIEMDTDTDDDEPRAPQVAETPVLLLAAHNGVRFDFPLLLCEVLRHGLPCWPFAQWLFVDTLTALQATARHGCVKLQCLSLRVLAETGRAHRALDDCVSLRQVMDAAAVGLGVSTSSLLARFAQELDLPSSLAQLAVLMTDA
jgi:DNA polymerase III epsilon subunit-like protein